MTLKRLCNNCNVVHHDDKIYCISYDSTVAVITPNGFTLGKHWNYSRTTLKHLLLFIEEYDFKTTQLILNNAKATKTATIRNLIDKNVFTYDDTLI